MEHHRRAPEPLAAAVKSLSETLLEMLSEAKRLSGVTAKIIQVAHEYSGAAAD
jgi:hypothetical protein